MQYHLFANSLYETLHQFVTAYKVHPILINFTAALIPVSLGSDILARIFDKQTLRDSAWWTLCFAAIITPFTATAGWLFWMEDDDGVAAMTIHKWLGTTLAVFLVGLVLWRWWFFKNDSRPSVFYLLVASAVVGAVVYQGYLGGAQTFSMFGGMDAPLPSDAIESISSLPYSAAAVQSTRQLTAEQLPAWLKADSKLVGWLVEEQLGVCREARLKVSRRGGIPPGVPPRRLFLFRNEAVGV